MCKLTNKCNGASSYDNVYSTFKFPLHCITLSSSLSFGRYFLRDKVSHVLSKFLSVFICDRVVQ